MSLNQLACLHVNLLTKPITAFCQSGDLWSSPPLNTENTENYTENTDNADIFRIFRILMVLMTMDESGDSL